MRLVIDTNQHISAIIQPNGNPAHILRIWRLGIIELAISPPILDEFNRVVHQPRIQQKYNLILFPPLLGRRGMLNSIHIDPKSLSRNLVFFRKILFDP